MMLNHLADNRRPDSWASRLRARRVALFLSLLDSFPRPVRVLDVGGTAWFWEHIQPPPHVEITLLNRKPETLHNARYPVMVGDACAMGDLAGQFDVVYSNSVIEHVGPASRQQVMAAEVRRAAPYYWIQTPNRYFPVEPHFLVPGWQFIPVSWRVWLLTHFRVGHLKRRCTPQEAQGHANRIWLLAERDLRALFPDATIYRERVAGLVKSLVAHNLSKTAAR